MNKKLLLLLCALGITATNCSLENECKVGQTRCMNNAEEQGGCGVCSNGAKTCSGKTLKTCQNGGWVTSTCHYFCKDNGSDCVTDTPQCNPGDTSCSGSTKQKCSDGHWSSNGSCPNGYSCAGSTVVSAKITQNVVIITSFRLVQMANGAELNPVSMAAVPQQMLVINHLITKI